MSSTYKLLIKMEYYYKSVTITLRVRCSHITIVQYTYVRTVCILHLQYVQLWTSVLLLIEDA